MNEVEEVKARLDIVDVIGQYVALHKAGRSFKAPCPFHNERTPSFIVTPERQSWHCFGACGTGGDVITFVMKKEGMEFPEALKMLANRAGVKLPERRVSDQEDRRTQRLYAANDAAARQYRHLLLESGAAREARVYLERRGIDEATADSFGLGFSLPTWEGLRDHLRQSGFNDDELLRAGLLVKGDSDLHDRFRGRLMFPIHDHKGRTVGFGARALDDSTPKYINTAQSPIFDKSSLVYAFHRAAAAIRREGQVVVVEGYMDAIAAHQHGFENVVASMGTALTERQVRQLRRVSGQIVLALDADAAGRDAAVRGHDVVREASKSGGTVVPTVSWRGLAGYQQAMDVELKVAVLPEGRDPDDVIRTSPADWKALIEGAQPVLDFRLDALVAAHDLTTPNGRSQLVQQFAPVLAAVTDPVVRAHYVQRLGRLAATAERELSTMLNPASGRGGASQRVPSPSQPPPQSLPDAIGDKREEYLLALLWRYPALREDGLEVSEDLLWGSEHQALFTIWKAGALRKRAAEDGDDGTEDVNSDVPMELRPYVERLSLRRLPEFDRKQARLALVDCVHRLKRRQLEAEKQAIGSLLADREAEVGASALVEAASSEIVDDTRLSEIVDLQAQDMRTGLRLHRKEHFDSTDNIETRDDG